MYDSDEKYKRARRIVREKEKFKKEVVSLIGVSIFLIAINLFTSPGYLWAKWPVMFMFLGSFVKGIKLYGLWGDGAYDEDELVEQELRRMNRGKRSRSWKNDDTLTLPPKSEGFTLKSLKKREKLHAEGSDSWSEKDLV